MLSPLKRVRLTIQNIQQRAYCFDNKVPPPGSNPNNAAQGSWSPYDHLTTGQKEIYIEDAMEFRQPDSKVPVQRAKGEPQFIDTIAESFQKKWGQGMPIKHWMLNKVREEAAKDQRFNAERLKTLGPDLAAAHFICARGGGVKFIGQDGFIQTGRRNYNKYVPGYRDDKYKVEAINVVFNIVYEGLTMLENLEYLKWISFKGNEYFDNWYMDKLSLVAPHLEFINLSGCKKLDHNAFGCIYRFKKLKCIVVEDCTHTDLFKLTCLTLESEYPDLVFVGLTEKVRRKSVFDS